MSWGINPNASEKEKLKAEVYQTETIESEIIPMDNDEIWITESAIYNANYDELNKMAKQLISYGVLTDNEILLYDLIEKRLAIFELKKMR